MEEELLQSIIKKKIECPMLEEFIEANGVRAKIVSGHPNSAAVKCRLFLADSFPVLVVALSSSRISEEKISKELSCTLLDNPSDSKAMEITGYEKRFLPPVSIYGVKVLLDINTLKKNIVQCSISEAESLEIEPEEIQLHNEEVVVGDYCK